MFLFLKFLMCFLIKWGIIGVKIGLVSCGVRFWSKVFVVINVWKYFYYKIKWFDG